MVIKRGQDLSALEARLEAVEKIQKQNLPRFLSALRRLGKLEKTVSANTTAISELKVIAKAATDNQGEIISLLRAGKTIGGYARKWGPRLLTFAVGVAVARGWITSDLAQQISHLFGL